MSTLAWLGVLTMIGTFALEALALALLDGRAWWDRFVGSDYFVLPWVVLFFVGSMMVAVGLGVFS
jgi:hypothetical protein